MKETFYTFPGAPHLALLTDLHNRPIKAIIKSLRSHRPDVIFIAGDVMYGGRPEHNRSPLYVQVNVLPFFKSCAAIAPTYFSIGNHETFLDEEDFSFLHSIGVTVLDNSYVREGRFVIGGLTCGHVTEYRKFKMSLPQSVRESCRYPSRDTSYDAAYSAKNHGFMPDVTWLSEFCGQAGFKILLCHHPEYIPLIPEEVDLVLSGHAHGGQWRIFGHGVFSPGQGIWPRWTKGVYDKHMIVSAGLSNTAPVPRFFNPTEIVYVNSPG